MSTNPIFHPGDKVIYEDRFRVEHEAIVIGLGEKDDELTYEVRLTDGSEKWGYADQLEAAR